MIRIILIGYMGAGKTTIGKALARSLNIPFYDLDWYIEERYRKSIAQLFAERGEEGFRTLEREMLHEVGEFENVILSSGGGTPCFYDNISYMNMQAETIYLKASPEVLFQHLKIGKTERPLLKNKTDEEMMSFIRSSLETREPYYNQAKHILNVNLLTEYKNIKETIGTIREMLNL